MEAPLDGVRQTAFVVVGLGIGVSSEMLHRTGADPHAVHRHRRKADELQRALDRDEFFLHYQPIVRLSDGELAGIEALHRWRHPDRGLLNPDQFIAAPLPLPSAPPSGRRPRSPLRTGPFLFCMGTRHGTRGRGALPPDRAGLDEPRRDVAYEPA